MKKAHRKVLPKKKSVKQNINSNQLARVPEKKNIWLSLAQICVSVLIGAVFVLYVLIIQKHYDGLLSTMKGEHNWKTALFFGSVIFAGSFSYDCTKKILFLDQETFKRFQCSLIWASTFIVLMYLALFASSFLIEQGSTTFGSLTYLAALGCVYNIVKYSTEAIEYGTK